MSTDQFGLWLNNSRLFNQLNDDTLKSKQCEIISFFGGFREVINLCMKHQFNINLLKHQKLFQLLISFKTEQENKLYEQNKLNTELITEETIEIKESESKPLILLDLHDICISEIFTYLKQSDHFSFQKTCKSLTIIGRKKESFRINPINQSYIDFGNYLQIEHKLSYIITHFQTNNIKHWDKAYNVFKTLSWTNKDSKIKLINSGIIQTLFSLCNITNANNENTNICQYILEHLFAIDSIASRNAFIKHGIFKIIKTFIRDIEDNEDLIDICFDILNDFIRENSSRAILLNGINFFPILVENLDWFYERIDENLTTLYHILSAPNFDWEKHDNILVFENMVNNLLYDWMDSIRAVFIQFEDEEDYESIPKISNSIVNIFDIININTNIRIKFQLNDSNLMSLILFLLKRTKDEKQIESIKQWLNIDSELLFNEDICEFVMIKIQSCTQLKFMCDTYMNLLLILKQNKKNNITICQQDVFERIRECLFGFSLEELTTKKKKKKKKTNKYKIDEMKSLHLWIAYCYEKVRKLQSNSNAEQFNVNFVYELFNFLEELEQCMQRARNASRSKYIIPHTKTESVAIESTRVIFDKLALNHIEIEKAFVDKIWNNNKLMEILNKDFNSNDIIKTIKCISIKVSMFKYGKKNDIADFVLNDNCKIFKQVIKACYESINIIPMKCCLKISKMFDYIQNCLVPYDIIYAFQDFISYFKNNGKYSHILCQVMYELNEYAKNVKKTTDNVVSEQLNLGDSTKKSILNNELTSQKVKDMVEQCRLIWYTSK